MPPRSSFQDDARETEMIRLFQLYRDEQEGRSGTDAYLTIQGQQLPLELKTSSKASVTTVRDFGPAHLEKWQGKHWLFGFYGQKQVAYKYASPSMMQPWIQSKANYIQPDLQLATLAAKKLELADLFAICGEKVTYSYDDAYRLQKKQYTREQYVNLQDQPNGYSPTQMLKILRDRAQYVMQRGSTLNNPHIPASYFVSWEAITTNHAQRLRELVQQYLSTL
ncbi:MAG: hypothetical protein F6J87_19450 [Spirulina sp. SIO3F2]|nr:hypothetical protein [Spirulina sp. SIO3F2]